LEEALVMDNPFDAEEEFVEMFNEVMEAALKHVEA
jgi:hypothetical protein